MLQTKASLLLLLLLVAGGCLVHGANLLVSVESVLKDIYRQEQPQTQNAWPPKFCHGLACPKYSVLSTGTEFETRLYSVSNWYSSTLVGDRLDAAMYVLFERLFKYISGDNVGNHTIKMTAPVITQIKPGPGPTCGNDFTLSFYNNLSVSPKPLDPSVFFSRLPKQKVYVRSFGGYANEKLWLQEAQELGAALGKQNLTFVKDHYFIAGYDSPFKLFGRHNEVWFLA